MTSETTAAKIIHPWSVDALLAKAQRYSQEMLSHSRDDWRFGLASTFVLEFVARAALARISPTLLADSRDWNNVYYALGHKPMSAKFIPRSIAISTVLARTREVLPTFTTELEGFASQHISRRNEELHTGSTPFVGLTPSWLAAFYDACTVLLASVGEDLALLVGSDESKVAEAMIAASRDDSAKAVMKAIAAHKAGWESQDMSEREKNRRHASTWATRQAGHHAFCPACGSDSLLMGAPISEPSLRLDGDLIVETQEFLPAKFECIACHLKIAGLSQLTACGLGNAYKATFTYDAADYYSRDDQYAAFDDDNNEY